MSCIGTLLIWIAAGAAGTVGAAISAAYSSTALLPTAQRPDYGWAVLGAGFLAGALLLAWLGRRTLRRTPADARSQAQAVEFEMLSLLAVHSKDTVMFTDAERRITWVNAAFVLKNGHSLAEAVGRHAGELLTGNGVDQDIRKDMSAALRAEQPFAGEVVNRSKAGVEYWVNLRIQPLHTTGGVLRGFVGIGTDVTEERLARQQVANTLSEAQLLLEGLAQHSLVLVTDGRGVITAVNDGLCARTGFSRYELLGQPYSTVNWDSQSATVWPDVWHSISKGELWRGDVCNAMKDGTLFWTDTSITPIKNAQGAIEKYISIQFDITPRMAEAARAQRSEALLYGAIEAVGEAFVLFDPEDRLVFCNDKYRRTFKTKNSEVMVGQSFESLIRTGAQAGMFPEAVGQIDGWVAEQVAMHRSRESNSMQLHSNGRVLRVADNILESGHTVCFWIDITDVVRSKEDAQSSEVAKGQFLANMSHELRSPMNAILGMLALIQKTQLSIRQIDYAGKAENSAKGLLGLLDSILDLSKMNADKMILDAQPFGTDGLLRELSVLFASNLHRNAVEFLFDIDPDLPPQLVGDVHRLRQVILNLGVNAIKFTHHGEVVLAIGVEQRQAAAVVLRVSVRDTGIGIAPESQTHIFDSFIQADNTITRQHGGSGLGLAISSRLVGLMGGTVVLRSVLGEGSEFSFTITLPTWPLPGAVVDEGEGVAGDVAVKRSTKRVMVVDDNAAACALTAQMCRSFGWEVTVCTSGGHALGLLASQADAGVFYQTVLLDWLMPDTASRQTLLGIRALALPGDLQVLLMASANGMVDLLQQPAVEQALIDGCLMKPFTASMLCDAVGHADAEYVLPSVLLDPAQDVDEPLVGMRLLLVEDNKINQQVAYELLQNEGAVVDIASNGQVALEMLASAQPQYDAVLMDMQMPVMDGLTATRAIRLELGLTDLPIVAMTANAMQSDRDACLMAGMNKHIAKPIHIDRLVELLMQYRR